MANWSEQLKMYNETPGLVIQLLQLKKMIEKPDLTTYSYEELVQAEANINRRMYPKDYKEVAELLSKYPKPKEKAKPLWVCLGWKYFAVSTLLMVLLLAYSLVFEKVLGRGWIYKSDQPVLYWILISIYVAGSVITADRFYKTWDMRRKQKVTESNQK